MLMSSNSFAAEARSRAGRLTINGDAAAITLRTKGEMEAAVGEIINRFERESLGRGPRDVEAHLIGDLVVVRLRGVLSAPEQQLARARKGRDLLKQLRTHLFAKARPLLATQVEEATGVKVTSMYHDISTVKGEEVVLFSLAETAYYRQAKSK